MFRTVLSFYNWLTLRDYEAAKEQATDQVVERLSRGNTLAQDGSSIERSELDQMSTAADAAMNRVARRLHQ